MDNRVIEKGSLVLVNRSDCNKCVTCLVIEMTSLLASWQVSELTCYHVSVVCSIAVPEADPGTALPDDRDVYYLCHFGCTALEHVAQTVQFLLLSAVTILLEWDYVTHQLHCQRPRQSYALTTLAVITAIFWVNMS